MKYQIFGITNLTLVIIFLEILSGFLCSHLENYRAVYLETKLIAFGESIYEGTYLTHA